MPGIFAYTILSVFIVSLISLIGVSTLALNEKILKKILLLLVSFSAGALFGDVFLHLIPEAAEAGFTLNISLYLLLGIIAFFILEKFIHWHHCHIIEPHKAHPQPYAIVNLIGDGFHNLVDGMLIAGSYLVSIPLGIATTVAVILHEIPQEIGDFGVLIHGGFTKSKAIWYNFISAIFAVLGAIIVLIAQSALENLPMFLVPFTAGGFIYIAGSDLIPQLQRETKPIVSFFHLTSFLTLIFIMFLLLFLEA